MFFYNHYFRFDFTVISKYDNKICNMTIDEEIKLLDEKSLKQKCKCDTLYSNWLEMTVNTSCEIKK